MLLGPFGTVQTTMDTLIKERPAAAGCMEKVPVDVDDVALLQARLTDGRLGLIEVSRMGTGFTNEVVVEIFGDKGAIRFNAADPSWLEIYDVRDAESPFGGMRGFKKIEAVGRYAGAKSPDWTMAPGFNRAHAEGLYQFCRAIWDDKPATPSLADGLHIQAIMAAAEQSSLQGGWIPVEQTRD